MYMFLEVGMGNLKYNSCLLHHKNLTNYITFILIVSINT